MRNVCRSGRIEVAAPGGYEVSTGPLNAVSWIVTCQASGRYGTSTSMLGAARCTSQSMTCSNGIGATPPIVRGHGLDADNLLPIVAQMTGARGAWATVLPEMNAGASRIVSMAEDPWRMDDRRETSSADGGSWMEETAARHERLRAPGARGMPSVSRELLARPRPTTGVSGGLCRGDDRLRAARGADPPGVWGARPFPDGRLRDPGGGQRSGGNAGPSHAQMYIMGTLLRHGSEAQKREYLPRIARGELRLQAFGVTEPEAGTDTTAITTTAVRHGDRYIINGRKVFISRVPHSDLLLLLARTTPRDQVQKRSHGLSVFLIDLHEAIGHGLSLRPIPTMINNETSELTFENLAIPATALVGEEGRGFPLHPRRHERRAHPDRGRMRRRRPLVHRRARLNARTSGSSSGGRSGRTRACSSRSPTPTCRSRPPT